MFTTKDLREQVKQMREKDFYIPKDKQRPIDWSAYTLLQINDVIDTICFVKEEVGKAYTFREHQGVGRPPVDAGELARAILFIESFGVTERKAEGWLLLLGCHLGIKQGIDDRVFGKAYQRIEVIDILERVFLNTLTCDGNMAGDGTGLEQSRKENYESTKKKGLYMTSIVDSREIVQAFDIGGRQECQVMHHLVKEITDIIKRDVDKLLSKAKLTLDSGFVDKKLAQLIEDSGLIPYIFPKKNNVLKSGGNPGWKRMLLNLLNDVQAWLREYHIRSHAESFHSSFKRIFGIITKRLDNTTYTQVLARIIHNNRRKTSYYKLAAL